jgi:hypothetical protein
MDILKIHHLAHCLLLFSLLGQTQAVDQILGAFYHNFIFQVTNDSTEKTRSCEPRRGERESPNARGLSI